MQDIECARATLGFAPATSLREGLGAELEWVTGRAAGSLRAVAGL